MKNFLSRLISTAFGIGYFPYGPGTLSALAVIFVYLFCPRIDIIHFIAIILAVTFLGVATSTITEKEMQIKSGESELHDPGIIVIDEIVGMLFALIALPHKLKFILPAFILFRFFDIVKPFPINKCEKLPAGWGIMLDDVVAGIFANIIIQIPMIIF